MAWRCDACGGTRAVYDTTSEEPKLLGCVRCDTGSYWREVVGDGYGTVTECVKPLSTAWNGSGRRCGRPVVVGALCGRHVDTPTRTFWDLATVYFRHRGPKGIPDAYRNAFRWAIEDAGLAVNEPSDEHEALARAAKLRKPSVVYFVEREGLIKIGTTKNLKTRLKALGKGGSMPEGMTVGPVKLLASTRGDRNVESQYHEKFRRQRIAKTEWFRPNKAIWREIETIQRTSTDVLADLVNRR